jgi:hypothetical protein
MLLRCELGGGLLLVDRDYIAHLLRKDMLYRLSVAVDVNGVTQMRSRFPGEDWSTVWNRETRPVLELCRLGWVALCILRDGSYSVDVHILQEEIAREGYRTLFTGAVSVRSGCLVAVELGHLIEAAYSGDHPQASDITVPSGEVVVRMGTKACGFGAVGKNREHTGVTVDIIQSRQGVFFSGHQIPVL